MDFKLLNTEETVSKLLTLIREAKEVVTLISPYVTLGAEDRVGRAIREALARQVKVNVVVRADNQTPLKESLLEAMLPHLESGLGLYVVPGLHAKLYRSESTVIITSLNLLASSFLNTIEVGLWSQDPRALAQTREFIEKEIQPHGQRLMLRGTPTRAEHRERPAKPRQPKRTNKNEGYCIRCCGGIALNPLKPYCRDDYEKWAEWSNEDYKDSYCHGCGDEFPATMRKPLCRDCYEAYA